MATKVQHIVWRDPTDHINGRKFINNEIFRVEALCRVEVYYHGGDTNVITAFGVYTQTSTDSNFIIDGVGVIKLTSAGVSGIELVAYGEIVD